MKNLRRLACKFDLNQSERKSTQVHASPGQTESQVDPSSQLGSTCDSVWPGLNMSFWLSVYSFRRIKMECRMVKYMQEKAK